jgi:hypothetical protein
MQTNNRLLDDLARLAGGAMGAAAGLRAELEGLMRQQFERLIAGLDLVRREEFDAVQAMAAKARSEQEALEKRVALIETALAAGRRETSSAG